MSGDAPPNSPFSQLGEKIESELSSTLSNLGIQTSIQDPSAITCLVHLKLIHAIAKLKESIGYTDGLFGIWDSRARYNRFKVKGGAVEFGGVTSNYLFEQLSHQGPGLNIISDNGKSLALSKLREKRWAIYVARAVDRYEAWWSCMFQLSETLSPAHEAFPDTGDILDWNNMVLPPLGKYLINVT
ncbi:hypothetical protein LRP88_01631 [Fusarium phalaenopsidis]